MNMTTKSPASGKVDTSNLKHTPILIALLLGQWFALLNETLLGNALTVLMKEFDVTASTIQWLSTAYMLVVGVLVPITALLQQWLTTRQMFLIAMVTFLVGTLIAGFAPTFSVLLIGIVQAVATGLITPLLMNTILIICPPEKRGATMGLIALVMMALRQLAYVIWSNCGFIKLALVILYCYSYRDHFHYDWDEVHSKCFRVNKAKSRLPIYPFIDIRIWRICV